MNRNRGVVTGILIILCVIPGNISASVFTGEGVLYFDRGHYWIELHLLSSVEDTSMAGDFSREQFVIIDSDKEDMIFSPSRVEVVSTDSGKKVVILSSGKLKGRKCYGIIFRSKGCEDTRLGPVCDPFYYSAGGAVSEPEGFFERYVASAFSTEGEYYRVNRLSYGYDLSSERTVSEIEIEPEFGNSVIRISPFFNYDRVAYAKDSGTGKETDRRKAGVDLSTSFWAGMMRYSTFLDYSHGREEESAGVEKELLYSQSISASFAVRYDNLFDRVNIDGSSVFKGMDLIFGYAWFDSSRSDLWKTDDFGRNSPFLKGRATWTVFSGLQISYAIESYWPSSSGRKAELMHGVRIRLLLRDLLESPRGRSYHPDLEFGIDRGRRFPLFEFEEKVFLGFTFDLYPW